MLAVRSKQLCFRYFQTNDTDLVNKLVQIFLKYKMNANVVDTLKMFLAFECWRKNSSAATEIVRLCIELNIQLSDNENSRYFDLLFNRKRQQKQEKQQPANAEKKKDVEKYKFKF